MRTNTCQGLTLKKPKNTSFCLRSVKLARAPKRDLLLELERGRKWIKGSHYYKCNFILRKLSWCHIRVFLFVSIWVWLKTNHQAAGIYIWANWLASTLIPVYISQIVAPPTFGSYDNYWRPWFNLCLDTYYKVTSWKSNLRC